MKLKEVTTISVLLYNYLSTDYVYKQKKCLDKSGKDTPGIVHGEKETQIKMWRNKRKPVKSNEKEMDTIALQSRTTNLSEGLCSGQR